MRSNKALQAELGMLLVTFIWGFGFPITKIASNHGFGPLAITAIRFFIGSMLISIIYRKRLKNMNKSYFKASVLTGVFLFLGFYFQTVGLEYTSVANNAFLTQMAVVFTPFISWMLFRKSPSVYAFIGAFIAILGIFVLVGGISFSSFNLGDFYTLLCAICVSIYVVSTQYYCNNNSFDTVVFSVLQFYVVAVVATVFALYYEGLPNKWYYLSSFYPIIILGIFNTAIGFTVQIFAIKEIGSMRTSVIVALEALIGAIAGIIIVNEPFEFNIILGGILIIIAIIISETQLKFLKSR